MACFGLQTGPSVTVSYLTCRSDHTFEVVTHKLGFPQTTSLAGKLVHFF